MKTYVNATHGLAGWNLSIICTNTDEERKAQRWMGMHNGMEAVATAVQPRTGATVVPCTGKAVRAAIKNNF